MIFLDYYFFLPKTKYKTKYLCLMLDTDPKAIQQINFTGHLDRGAGAKMFFIIEEAKEETVLGLS